MSEIKKVKLELPEDVILPQGCEFPEIEISSVMLKRTVIQDDDRMVEIEEVIGIPIIQKFNKNPNSVVCVDIKTELQDVIRRIYESLPDFDIKGCSIEVIDPICINYNNKGYLKFQVIRSTFGGDLINEKMRMK